MIDAEAPEIQAWSKVPPTRAASISACVTGAANALVALTKAATAKAIFDIFIIFSLNKLLTKPVALATGYYF